MSTSAPFVSLTFRAMAAALAADSPTGHVTASPVPVVFAVRTRLPLIASRPSRTMLLATALVCAVAVALPYTPLAGLLDFTPLPPNYLLGLAAIVALYVLAAELTKRWFYRRFGAGDLGSGTGLKGG